MQWAARLSNIPEDRDCPICGLGKEAFEKQ